MRFDAVGGLMIEFADSAGCPPWDSNTDADYLSFGLQRIRKREQGLFQPNVLGSIIIRVSGYVNFRLCG